MRASRRWALLIATWGGVGYVPGAPGTAGSLAGAAVAYLLLRALDLSTLWTLAFAAALFGPACWAATRAEQYFQRRDPAEVVVDEVVGQWIALTAAGPRWPDWLAAIVLFRLFDILKPFPVRRFERLPAGYGVVADDAAAGFCAMIILAGLKGLGLW